MESADNRSVPDLLASALSQASILFRSEIQLARAEISGNVASAGIGVGLMAAAGMVMTAALVLLLVALAAFLVEEGIDPPVADLLAGVIGLIVSGGMLLLGKRRLRADAIVPRKTIDQLNRDVATVKEQVR